MTCMLDHSLESLQLLTLGQSFVHLNRGIETVNSRGKDLENIHCPMKFSDKSPLKSHEITVDFGIKDFECKECGKKSNDKGNLTNHIITIHIGDNILKCIEWQKRFTQSF